MQSVLVHLLCGISDEIFSCPIQPPESFFCAQLFISSFCFSRECVVLRLRYDEPRDVLQKLMKNPLKHAIFKCEHRVNSIWGFCTSTMPASRLELKSRTSLPTQQRWEILNSTQNIMTIRKRMILCTTQDANRIFIRRMLWMLMQMSGRLSWNVFNGNAKLQWAHCSRGGGKVLFREFHEFVYFARWCFKICIPRLTGCNPKSH